MAEMPGGPLEQKAVAAPFTTLVAGYISAVLVEAVPWLRDHLTPDQRQNLPIIIAFLLSAVAAYFAPHTHRPDLGPEQSLASALADAVGQVRELRRRSPNRAVRASLAWAGASQTWWPARRAGLSPLVHYLRRVLPAALRPVKFPGQRVGGRSGNAPRPCGPLPSSGPFSTWPG